MRQVFILGIHTVANLEASCIVNAVCSLECEEIAFVRYHLELVDVVYMVNTFLVSNQSNEFNTNCIIQSSFIYNDFDIVLVTGNQIAINNSFFLLDISRPSILWRSTALTV